MTIGLRPRLLLPALVLVLAVGAGVAYAAIPGGNGVISGCFKTVTDDEASKGSLRVIDTGAGETCKRNETPLQWNQKGLKGDPGIAGVAGSQGPKGERGEKGETGAQGSKGDAGSPGAAGLRGEAGPVGPAGSPGMRGDVGPKGEPGAPGSGVAYSFASARSGTVVGQGDVTVVSGSLPPSAYVLFATVKVGGGPVICGIKVPVQTSDPKGTLGSSIVVDKASSGPSQGTSNGTIALMATHELSATGTVRVECYGLGGYGDFNEPALYGAKMTALPVGQILRTEG